ncbi:amidase [Ammoniphilus sp. CFH 90114]|uniref:amidase n=1 Tax=Ammoniphilus sp. CFH 90114 TaxID=2493665 RepID=UPI00100EA269|nr:amidase [Ammoniphilus sp. CFH 90114]RXT04327.1 amidase [Ammoniphilus sp. CFH 90114]
MRWIKYLLLGVLFLSIVFTSTVSSVQATKPQKKQGNEEVMTLATWLWHTDLIESDQERILTFLEQKQVTHLYLQIHPSVARKSYQTFIQKLSAKNVEVHALSGGPDWVLAGTETDAFFQWVMEYQKASKSNQKFKGIHLDVEPYLLPGWENEEERNGIIKSYQQWLERSYRQAKQLGLPMEVDIPFWFDEIAYQNEDGQGYLAEWIIRKVDGVTIMAYRDTAEMIQVIVKQEMEWARIAGKKVFIAVETNPSVEAASVTFYEEGRLHMDQQLRIVRDAYKGSSSFGGMAVHDLKSWLSF